MLLNKIFELDELKRLLGVENVKSYDRFPDFRRKVLEKAQEEINEQTDLNIDFDTIKKGRKVIKIKFRIDEKKHIERTIARTTANERLRELN